MVTSTDLLANTFTFSCFLIPPLQRYCRNTEQIDIHDERLSGIEDRYLREISTGLPKKKKKKTRTKHKVTGRFPKLKRQEKILYLQARNRAIMQVSRFM